MWVDIYRAGNLAAQPPHVKELCDAQIEYLDNTKACLRTLNSTQAGLIACFAFYST